MRSSALDFVLAYIVVEKVIAIWKQAPSDSS